MLIQQIDCMSAKRSVRYIPSNNSRFAGYARTHGNNLHLYHLAIKGDVYEKVFTDY